MRSLGFLLIPTIIAACGGEDMGGGDGDGVNGGSSGASLSCEPSRHPIDANGCIDGSPVRNVDGFIPCELVGSTLVQVAVQNQAVAGGKGFYLDDFSEAAQSCPGSGRIAFTAGTAPPSSAVFECVQKIPEIEAVQTDIDLNVEQPGIGSRCDFIVRNGQTLQGNQACQLRLVTGEYDTESLFCLGALNVCVRACEGHEDCPAGLECTSTNSLNPGHCHDPACP